MAAVLLDGEMRLRLVIGATGGRPILLHDEAGIADALAGLDPVAAHIQAVSARRALAQARA